MAINWNGVTKLLFLGEDSGLNKQDVLRFVENLRPFDHFTFLTGLSRNSRRIKLHRDLLARTKPSKSPTQHVNVGEIYRLLSPTTRFDNDRTETIWNY
jgi:hypothetical protein